MAKQEIEIIHSKWNMMSYGAAKGLNELFSMAFAAFGFYFYETEIGLNVWLTSLGYIIFAIWNAVNDPLVGYLTNRPFKFTKKWGRRFPWILMGGIPWMLSYALIFLPPSLNPQTQAIWLFLWLIMATCLYDTFNSIWWIGFSALFPDKFRSVNERRTVQAIATPMGIIGITLGALLPPLIIHFGDLQSYVIQAGVMIMVGFLIFAASMPGSRDDQLTVERYIATYDSHAKRESFIETLKIALKQKSFVVFILAYTFYQTLTVTMQASLPYEINYVLGEPASVQTLISAGFLIGALISSPLWIKYAHKVNDNRRVIIYAGIVLIVFTIPLTFIRNYIVLFIEMVLWGLGFGGFWAILAPVLADVIDESIVITHKREEGIYMGFQSFFGRAAIILQALTFAIVHTLTGFQQGAATQSAEANIGISLHFGLIPALFMVVSVLLLWRGYKLTPDVVKANQQKIKELGL